MTVMLSCHNKRTFIYEWCIYRAAHCKPGCSASAHTVNTHRHISVYSQVHKFCSVIPIWSRSMIILCFTGHHANGVHDNMCDSIFWVFAIIIIINFFVCTHKGRVLSCSRLVLFEGLQQFYLVLPWSQTKRPLDFISSPIKTISREISLYWIIV